MRPAMTELRPLSPGPLLHSNKHTRAGDLISPEVLDVFACKKLLGRTETRTRDRMYCQTIRTVKRHLPRRSSKNCDLQFAKTERQTDRLKENYGIDNNNGRNGSYLTWLATS